MRNGSPIVGLHGSCNRHPEIKRSNIIEARRVKVSPDVRRRVEISFMIADRIHELLQKRGLKQKDLAERMNKNESEISKWMRGSHNITLETMSQIECVLGDPILMDSKA